MFSSYRNHSKTIDQSQRFYYDNYDYYNIYENLQKDYKDDLSKFIYHCNRRTTPLIITFGTQFRFKYLRMLKNNTQYKSMQDFVNKIISIFMENNYFIPTRMLEKQKNIQNFVLQYFSPVVDIKYKKDGEKQYNTEKIWLPTTKDLVSCIQMLKQENQRVIVQLSNQYQNQQNRCLRLRNLQFYYAIQLYSARILGQNYQKANQVSFMLLFQFVVEMHRLMWDILHGKYRTVLLMAQPKTYLFNLIIHPLIMPIQTFLKYNHNKFPQQIGQQFPSPYKLISGALQKKPKIIIINLDGRQSCHNLRSIGTLGQQILYISIFEQPSWLDKKQNIMQNLFTSQQQDYQPSYKSLWQIYSQAIIKQYKKISQTSKSNLYLFPFNSTYIFQKYIQKIYQQNPNTKIDSHTFLHNNLQQQYTSQLIHSLFEQILYQKIRMYNPTMIFISYNGQLSIIEQHFNDIIRNCSIIADHRVILFTNFVHYFQDQSINISDSQQQGDKLLCVHQFYQKYYNYQLQVINQQRLYSNIQSFMKYGGGLYSMQDRIFGSPSSKYNIGKYYNYLQILIKIQQFYKYQQFILRKWNSNQLNLLYQSYLEKQIKQNKKQNKFYQNLINVVINQLICRNISQNQLEGVLGKKVYYRFKFVCEELMKQYEYVKKIQAQYTNNSEMEQQMGDSETVSKLLQNYLQKQKQKLLAQNLQNYKIKKYFYLAESQKSFGQVSCFKFILISQTGSQGQQIYLQKYSQVIVNQQYQQLFILNYKRIDNHHIHLYGSIKNSQLEKQIKVYQINQTDLYEDIKASFQQIYLNQEGQADLKQDIVFLQILYIFWPLKWNVKDQVRCKLLGIQYKPERVWRMIKIYQPPNQLQFKYQKILYQSSQGTIKVLPRWGCTCLADNNQTFQIFGGIFDSKNDFTMIGTGISIAQITNNGKYKTFNIRSQPKTKNKSTVVSLRPKINYIIHTAQDKNQQNCLRINGGYGRANTGFFNLFSYDQYAVNSALIPQRQMQGKLNKKIVNTEKPLQSDKIGKFNVIVNNYNVAQIEQKFSDGLKDKFFFQRRVDMNNKPNQWEILSFIDQTYRVNQYKTDPKKLFLFGFDRTVRQKIYTRCWSPQMYIIDGVKDYIVNLSLKTQKTSSYIITNYLMPRQQDIVSLCLEQDRLYLLSNSPIIHSIDRAGLKFVLYQGSLANISQVMRKKQIQMITKHNFNESCQKYLNQKTIFIQNQKIYLVGGLCNQPQNKITQMKYQREDYIMQAYKNRFKIKIRKIQSIQLNLDMPNSVIIKQNQHFYLYSIVFEDKQSQLDQKQGIEWKIKIQKYTYQNSQSNQIKIGGFKTYVYNKNYKNNQLKVQKYQHSKIDKPKFVKIMSYQRSNFTIIRQIISKIIWKIDTNQLTQQPIQNIKIIKQFHNQKNDKQLVILFNKNLLEFEKMIEIVKKRIQNLNQINLQQQDLLRDLSHLYQLMIKLILEEYLFLGQPQQNQYMFIIQDISSKKTKYIAVGSLYTTQLNFFRIRFKYQLLINLNSNTSQGLFYHPTATDYYRFDNQVLKVGDSYLWNCEEIVKPIKVSVKQ